MKIAILGTRGIPNNYGGFEECAEKLSLYFTSRGHQVTVYNPDYHPYTGSQWRGVRIKKNFCRENKIGYPGTFIYDYLCLRDAFRGSSDIILELGYSPAALFYFLHTGKKSCLLTNMDGLDWKRDKWNWLARKILRFSEKKAVQKSDFCIADNPGIQDYLRARYKIEAVYLPYGAESIQSFDPSILPKYQVTPGRYLLSIARLEPENNLEMMLAAHLRSGSRLPFLVVGPNRHKYGRRLMSGYSDPRIRFLGGIYRKKELESLRHFCRYYLHGHSVGGTNPSLLEAMAAGAPIVSYDCGFNRHVLGEDALFFQSREELIRLLTRDPDYPEEFIAKNSRRIAGEYDWDRVGRGYLALFQKALAGKGREDPGRSRRERKKIPGVEEEKAP